MRARAAIVAGLLIAVVPLDSPAQAQLSPQGIIGGVTRPLRQMLEHFGHFCANRIGRFLQQAVADAKDAIRGHRPLTHHMPNGTLALLLSVRLR
jgi:hypothetical protein